MLWKFDKRCASCVNRLSPKSIVSCHFRVHFRQSMITWKPLLQSWNLCWNQMYYRSIPAHEWLNIRIIFCNCWVIFLFYGSSTFCGLFKAEIFSVVWRTRCYQVVTHLRTNRNRHCLTSVVDFFIRKHERNLRNYMARVLNFLGE